MPDPITVRVKVTGASPTGKTVAEETICREMALKIVVNSIEAVTVLCSPADLDQLVTGMLLAENMIQKLNDIEKLDLDMERQTATVQVKGRIERRKFLKPLVASGGGKGFSAEPETVPVASDLHMASATITRLMNQFLIFSDAYAKTSGVHSAALVKGGKIAIFKDDIGRHNALDKVFGECLQKAIPTGDAAVLLSGRISSEMLLKVARRGVPILVTKAVPTDRGVQLAEKLGVTVARATAGKVTVYTHAWRID